MDFDILEKLNNNEILDLYENTVKDLIGIYYCCYCRNGAIFRCGNASTAYYLCGATNTSNHNSSMEHREICGINNGPAYCCPG